MQRYIVRYRTLHNKSDIMVIKSKSLYMATPDALDALFEKGVVEILEVRELYNPYHDLNNVVTEYELSLLKNGIHEAITELSLTTIEYNKIAQIYGEELK